MGDAFNQSRGEWHRLFRQNMWAARARRDEARKVWLIEAVDHENLAFSGEAPGDLTPEEALDRAELLAP